MYMLQHYDKARPRRQVFNKSFMYKEKD